MVTSCTPFPPKIKSNRHQYVCLDFKNGVVYAQHTLLPSSRLSQFLSAVSPVTTPQSSGNKVIEASSLSSRCSSASFLGFVVHKGFVDAVQG